MPLKPPRHLPRPEPSPDLIESIRRFGLAQPVVTLPSGEVVLGEGRRQAAERLGLEVTPHVIQATEVGALALRLSDEMAKSHLTPMAKARALRDLREMLRAESSDGKVGHAILAAYVGTTEATITSLMAMLNLPDEVADMAENGEIGREDARALAKANMPPETKKKMARRFADKSNPAPGGQHADRSVRIVKNAAPGVQTLLLEHRLDLNVGAALTGSGLSENEQVALGRKALSGKVPGGGGFPEVLEFLDRASPTVRERLLGSPSTTYAEAQKMERWENEQAERKRVQERDAQAWSAMAFFRRLAIVSREYATSFRVTVPIATEVPDAMRERVRASVANLRDECDRFLEAMDAPAPRASTDATRVPLKQLEAAWGPWADAAA
jgi:ParB/RepB/Spo0J family partition protein